MRRWGLGVGVVLLAVVAGGCGSSGSPPPPRTATPAPGATEITYLCPKKTMCGVLGDGSATGVLPLPGVEQGGGTSLSPDGRQAASASAFISEDESTNYGVTLQTSTGDEAKTLLRRSPIDYDRSFYIPGPSVPAWNPQGDTLAVSEPTLSDTLDYQDCQIWIVPTSGHGAHPLDASGSHSLRCDPPTDQGQSLSWNPSGTKLAYATPQGLWTVPVAGGSPKMIRATPGLTLGSVAWSPDGSTILAEVVSGTGRSVSEQNGSIESFPVNGRAPTVVIPAAVARIRLLSPGLAWAPGGDRFAFVSVPAGGTPGYRIVTATADGTGLRTVAQLAYDNPFALTGWTRTASKGSSLGHGATPTTAAPPPPVATTTTTVPVQPPAAGPVPAVTGLDNLANPPTVAPSTGAPPTSLVGKDLIVGHGPPVTINSTVTERTETVAYSTGQPDPTSPSSSWNAPNPAFAISDAEPGYRNALIGMRPGGVREVVIPPQLGYGYQAVVFIVQLLSVT